MERQVTKSICDAFKTLSDGTKGDKVDAAALTKAQATLNAARTKWNTGVYNKLKDLAKQKDSAIRSKPL